jgi:TolB protein
MPESTAKFRTIDRPFAAYWGRSVALIALLAHTYAVNAQPSADIAYLSGARYNDLIVCVLHVGSDAVDVVGTGQRDGRPMWSPDGEWLAHTFDHDGERRIRIVKANGADAIILPSPGGPARHPRWSPDGNRIAFIAGPPNAEQIFVYDRNTKTIERWGSGNPALLQPAWVSDDRLVAVGRIGKPGSQTTDLFWVTQTRADRIDDALPDHGKYFEWAPSSPGIGEFLAFESDDGGDREIIVYAPQRGAIDVSNHRAADWNPRWSPDRRNIAFESFRGGHRGIYQVNALRVLVNTVSAPENANAWDPNWSPDGDWIVYVSDLNGAADLFATRSNGEETVQLTNTPGLQLAPAWRPVR